MKWGESNPRNVGSHDMEMASELSQQGKKTIFGMIESCLKILDDLLAGMVNEKC